jgi:hypothetical protein
MRRFAVLSAVVLGVLVVVAVAIAGTTTIGHTGGFSGGALIAGTEQIANDAVVPFGGGTITSLNTQAHPDCIHDTVGYLQGTYNLQVLHPLGGGQYQVLGETGNQVDTCDGQFHSYPVNIPVQAGDVLAAYTVALWMAGTVVGSRTTATISEPGAGDTITVTGGPFSQGIDMSATLIQPTPATANDCRNGGWTTLVDDNGNPFKNQGACVSFVNKQ